MQVQLDLVDAHDARRLCDRRARRCNHQAAGQIRGQQEERLLAAGERIEGDVGPVFLQKQNPFAAVRLLSRSNGRKSFQLVQQVPDNFEFRIRMLQILAVPGFLALVGLFLEEPGLELAWRGHRRV